MKKIRTIITCGMCGSKPIFRNYYILNLHMKKHKPEPTQLDILRRNI